MRRFRILLGAVLVALAVGACSNPTLPPYPTPDDTKPPEPPPNPGFVQTNR